MSINMDMEQSSDYSDFRYQQFAYEHRDAVSGQPNNRNSRGQVEFDVLDEIGGLDTNEVAELVYLELTAQIEFENENDDQTAASAAEFRGAFGVDLTESDEPGNPPQQDQGEVTNTSGGTPDGDINIALGSSVRDEVFQIFAARGVSPFTNTPTNGGGGGGTDSFHAEKNWRQLTGRGPILDSADNLSIVSALICANQTIEFEGRVRGHLVWDVAEVDEAGRRFSVPSM